ncbi:MAG: hypothetical protein WHT46_03095 [Candidatus Geothermincolales bacterium]
MRLVLVIPTYWGRRSGEPMLEGDACYDHPTCIDQPGTLSRALESVRILRHDDLKVVVIGAAVAPELEEEMEEKVSSTVEAFKESFPVAFLGPGALQRIKALLEEEAGRDAASVLELRGYSNIRNVCLAAACGLGAEAAVLFDDDEVYEDPAYLEKVEEVIGAEFNGHFVGGLAGVYVNADGSIFLPPQKDWVFSCWPSVESMNAAFSAVKVDEGLKVTPWVFGGNMVIHRELFLRVAFDPRVTRGEDIDYLINARMLGYRFFLHPGLRVKHLPPPKTAPLWRRFREDVDRFIYTREKINSELPEGWIRVRPEELDPYPGRFLREDLDDMVFKTCVLMGMSYLRQGDERGFSECMANLQRRDAVLDGYPPALRYAEFLRAYRGCMGTMAASRRIRAYLESLYN